MSISQITPITAGEIRRNGYVNSFDRHVGISTEGFISHRKNCTVTAIPQETALNPHGCVHGGWTATLLDTVAGGVAYSNKTGALEDNEYGLTSALDIEFKVPVFSGETYTCAGKIIHRDGNNIQTRATLADSKGVEVATASALIKARRVDYKALHSKL